MTVGSSTFPDVEATTTVRVHVRFITNRCVSACVDAREQPEWPPHPGRLYMALVAAYFETDGDAEDKDAERRALEWLASQPPPRMHAVDAEERTTVVGYVPVNDAPQPNKAMLQSAPGMPRSRQSRTFPTVIPQRTSGADRAGADITFEWMDAPPSSEFLLALDRLCRNVIRIGHSSSLVMVWAEAGSRLESERCWEPSTTSLQLTCRIAAAGELERLQALCQAERIELFAALKQEIESTKGKPQKAAKARFAEAFGESYKASIRPPEPTPATLGVWQGYRLAKTNTEPDRDIVENQYFDHNLIILAKDDGPVLNVERTLGLTTALRKVLISVHDSTPMPAWLSGHEPDGSPTSSPHAAFLPLPFVGFPHADGHLMGLAIALPKGISFDERARWLGPLLVDQNVGDASLVKLEPRKDPKEPLKIWSHGLPDWTLQLEERPSPPRVLQNETWTRPSTIWASVTPVVLDRFPKRCRLKDRNAWQAEVVEIIKQACIRGGLPEPIDVDIDSTAWHAGVPRAWAKKRRLGAGTVGRTAPLGDGFPSLEAKPSRPAKPQVHVWLRFSNKVAGPVVIGAGRFGGYGLCMPLSGK
jgi:CRISPR-associated protein Csb2